MLHIELCGVRDLCLKYVSEALVMHLGIIQLNLD